MLERPAGQKDTAVRRSEEDEDGEAPGRSGGATCSTSERIKGGRVECRRANDSLVRDALDRLPLVESKVTRVDAGDRAGLTDKPVEPDKER